MAVDERSPGADAQQPAAEGVYVYCIIEANEPRDFGTIGIGGRGDEVYTVHYRDLAAVVSERRSSSTTPRARTRSRTSTSTRSS